MINRRPTYTNRALKTTGDNVRKEGLDSYSSLSVKLQNAQSVRQNNYV